MTSGQTESLMTNDTVVKEPKSRFNIRRKTVIIIIVLVLCVITAFVVGMVLGIARMGAKMEKIMTKIKMKQMQAKQQAAKAKSIRAKAHMEILADLKTENLKKNLRYFSLKPHVAALPRNDELGEEIYNRFKSYGFRAEKTPYNVLLSYPKKDKPNYAHIVDKAGKAVFTTQKKESALEPNEKSPDVTLPFNAYSPAKTVEGELVYANYGGIDDFEELINKYNVSVSGKIVIVRYGKMFRGNKVRNAEIYGAIGVLIFSDPEDYGPVPDDQLYPNGWWLPRDGLQMGSVDRGDADPLTPGYPSTDGAYRIDPNGNSSTLPRIPSQPISAKDATVFLSNLGGNKVKDKRWIGGLKITYRTGPGFMGNHSNHKVKLEVHNERKQMKITNIIGTIKGSVEPDRYVLIGNHRDAWIFGANDASSGTTVMMEVARAMGEQLKKGWRPRRSIVFCSWDGEEANIIGSSEWVEQHIRLLTDRAVAYVNMDTAVSGNYTIGASASPLAYSTVIDAASKAQDPTSSMTVLEKYIKASPSKTRTNYPNFGNLGSGSDFLKFYQLVGVPSMDFTYSANMGSKFRWFYPVYHSLHDTFHWMSTFSDPEFKTHLAVSKVAAHCLLAIADTPLLPWKVQDYAIELKRGVTSVKDQMAKHKADSFGASTKYLESAVKKFGEKADAFQKSLKSKDLSNPITLRMINDRLMQLEKGLILPEGLPGRPYIKHLVYAPALHNSYASTHFSGVVDQLHDIGKNPRQWETVKLQLTILASRIEAAADTLDDDM